MPAGAIHDEYGMCALFDVTADLVDMKLHGFGSGKGQSQSRADAAPRADRAEQIGPWIPLTGGLPRGCAPFSLLPHDAVLLADSSFVLT